ncbi:MipA/OmpV family protein [Marinomonas algicola]|uniref:MipA/OmpV family protein n=1 Tax=Marinomonas algicola TaxID=2773454 RepID=UPI00174DCB82|nr:MipA/OmpV family protein [Marinomonas algicola]
MEWSNNNRVSIGASTAVILGALMSTSSLAADFSATVGGIVMGQENYIIGEDSEVELLPYVSLEYGMLTLDEDGLALTFEIDGKSAVSAGLSQRSSVFERKDNKVLKHFDKRDTATELTVNWIKSFDEGDVSFAVAGDVSNTHDGYEVMLGLSKQIPSFGGLVIPSVELSLQSEALVDYYYGVKDSEATSSIASYKAKESLSAGLSVAYKYRFSESWSAFSHVGWTYLGSGISDSPIVKKDNVWLAVIGGMYTF